MDRVPRPGEFYRHFKDRLYQIVALAEHSETGETLVIYQALYGDFRTYARPLVMFSSEVDRLKYPDAAQRYRFEQVVGAGQSVDIVDIRENEEESALLNPSLLSFIEAETYEGRLEALHHMRGKVSQDDLGMIYVALDMKKVEGSVDAQLDAVEQILSMQRHYDGGHLR